jgi:AraC family transcriptional regulator
VTRGRHQNALVPEADVLIAKTPRLRWRPCVERVHTGSGEVRLAASTAHRLRLHVGRPVSGSCSRGQTIHYTRGDLDLLPAGYDEVCVQQTPTTSLMIELPPLLLHSAAEDMGLSPARAQLDLRHQLRDKQLELIALALEAESAADHASGQLYSESLVLALSARLLRVAASDGGRPLRGLSPTQRSRLLDFIESYLDQPLSLQRLARVSGTSASHLKTLFKRSMGVSVHAYVVQRRVARARQLLLKGELPSSQIALESGFAHQSHMARCVRRLLGVTPSDLRAR